MFCTHCGKEVPDGTRICSHCGGAIAAQLPGTEIAPELHVQQPVEQPPEGLPAEGQREESAPQALADGEALAAAAVPPMPAVEAPKRAESVPPVPVVTAPAEEPGCKVPAIEEPVVDIQSGIPQNVYPTEASPERPAGVHTGPAQQEPPKNQTAPYQWAPPQETAPQPAQEEDTRYKPVSTAGFFWSEFLLLIPVLNLILLLVWAFSKRTNPSRRAFARSLLVWFVLALVVILVGIVALLVLRFDFNALLNRLEQVFHILTQPY